MHHPTFLYNDLKKITGRYTAATTWDSKTGAVVISEFGARILGLFPEAKNTNTLWAHPRMDAILQEKNFLTGGERLWIAPERDFYYNKPETFEDYLVQSPFDPGNYQTVGEGLFENNFDLINKSSKTTYKNCKARRSITRLSDPLGSNLAYMGVRISDSITLTVPDYPFAAWSLTQLYVINEKQAGTAFFPCKPTAQPLFYFNPIPKDRFQVHGEGYTRFKLDAAEIYKLVIKPEDTIRQNPCKALYVSAYPESNTWFCVAKRTDDDPLTQTDCYDQARETPEGPRGGIQSYNNGPGFAKEMLYFGEIESQFRCRKSEKGTTTSSGTHELISYSGSKGEILEIAQTLLGIKSAPMLY